MLASIGCRAKANNHQISTRVSCKTTESCMYIEGNHCPVAVHRILIFAFDFFLALYYAVPHHSHDSSEYNNAWGVKPKPSTSHKARRSNDNPPRTSAQRLTI